MIQIQYVFELTKALHKEILTGDIDSAVVGSSFAAQDDAWEENFQTRTGFLLARYLQNCSEALPHQDVRQRPFEEEIRHC